MSALPGSWRERLRDERGATLPDLLMSMVIGSFVLFALLTVFTNSITGVMRASDRAEAAQSGRVALDRMTTVLGSQVCLDASNPPITAGSDDSVTFYADLETESFTPRQFRYTYDETTKLITESMWDGSGSPPTFTGSPTRDRNAATDVVRQTGTPIFRYYAYTTSGTIEPTVLLSTPLSATDARRVVLVKVTFSVLSKRTATSDGRAAAMEGEAYALNANAFDPATGVTCL